MRSFYLPEKYGVWAGVQQTGTFKELQNKTITGYSTV